MSKQAGVRGLDDDRNRPLAIGASVLHLITVLLRPQFASHPFAGVNAENGAAKSFAILTPAERLAVLRVMDHPVVRTVVRDVKDFIEDGVGLGFPSARVLVRKIFM